MTNSVWQWHGNKAPLTLTQQPLTALKPNQVQVCNSVIPINPVDWKLAASGHPSWTHGHVPGVDGVGTICAVGDNVSAYWVGKRVAYHADLTCHGSFSRFTAVDAERVIALPDSVSNQDAGWIPCPGLTAAQIVEKIPALPGRKTLVCGASGAVGTIVTQLLIQQGAEVYATASASQHKRLLSFGVAGCVDYRESDWLDKLTDIVPSGFDAAVDLVSVDNAKLLYPQLSYEAHLVSVLGRVEHQGDPFGKCVSLHEVALGASYQHANAHQVARITQTGEQLAELIVNDRIVLSSPSFANFEQLGDLLMALQQGTASGKWMIRVND